MSTLALDAEALADALADGIRPLLSDRTALLGIWSGGAWLAERLAARLEPRPPLGTISSAMHRDDFGERGMAGGRPGAPGVTRIAFDVDGADIVLVDDVLHTGRTVRAVLNELFDYGRPSRVRLAVLVDRGGRELPIEPAFAAARVVLAPAQRLRLARGDGGRLDFRIDERPAPRRD